MAQVLTADSDLGGAAASGAAAAAEATEVDSPLCGSDDSKAALGEIVLGEADLAMLKPPPEVAATVVVAAAAKKVDNGMDPPSVYFSHDVMGNLLGTSAVFCPLDGHFYNAHELKPDEKGGMSASVVAVPNHAAEVREYWLKHKLLTPSEFTKAISFGDLDTLNNRMYARRYLNVNGLLGRSAVSIAAYHGQMGSLNWLLEKKCPVTLESVRSAVGSKATLQSDWLLSSNHADHADRRQTYLDVLRLVVDHCQEDVKSAAAASILPLAVRVGSTAAVQLLREREFPMGGSTGLSTLYNYCTTVPMAQYLMDINVSVLNANYGPLIETVGSPDVWLYLWEKAVAMDPAITTREHVMRNVMLAACKEPRVLVLHKLLKSSPTLVKIVADPGNGHWATMPSSKPGATEKNDATSPLIKLIYGIRRADTPLTTAEITKCCKMLLLAGCPLEFQSKESKETALHAATIPMEEARAAAAPTSATSANSSVASSASASSSARVFPPLSACVVAEMVTTYLSMLDRKGDVLAEAKLDALWKVKNANDHTPFDLAVACGLGSEIMSLLIRARVQEKKGHDARVANEVNRILPNRVQQEIARRLTAMDNNSASASNSHHSASNGPLDATDLLDDEQDFLFAETTNARANAGKPNQPITPAAPAHASKPLVPTDLAAQDMASAASSSSLLSSSAALGQKAKSRAILRNGLNKISAGDRVFDKKLEGTKDEKESAPIAAAAGAAAASRSGKPSPATAAAAATGMNGGSSATPAGRKKRKGTAGTGAAMAGQPASVNVAAAAAAAAPSDSVEAVETHKKSRLALSTSPTPASEIAGAASVDT